MIDIDQLKERNNIVDVINSLVPLKKTGKNYQACCPFHSEKTPSFNVNEQKQFYHCFGCGAHGDVVGFVQDYYSVDFLEASKILGGEHDDLHSIQVEVQKRPQVIRLPLEKKPHDINKINDFLSNKCELMNGCYFYGDYQAIRLTDINKNVVSCALVRGKGFDNKWFKKEFLYGSCSVLGDIETGKDVFLCEDYSQCLKLRLVTEKCCVCYFEPLNLSFIVNEIKRKTQSLIVVANSEESINQADSLNLINCYMKEYNEDNKVKFNV